MGSVALSWFSHRSGWISSHSFLALALLAMGLSGCRPLDKGTPTNSSAAASVRTTTVNTVSFDRVRATPLYKQAEVACTRKQYSKAAEILNRLAASADNTTDEKAFCLQQRDLCLRYLTPGPQPTMAASPTLRKVPHNTANASPDCGPRALLLACQKVGVKATLESLRQRAGTTEKGTTLAGLSQAATSVGLKTEGVQVSREALGDVDLPAIAWVNENHFVVLLSVNGSGEQATVTVRDPNKQSEETLLREKFLRESGGYLLLLRKS